MVGLFRLSGLRPGVISDRHEQAAHAGQVLLRRREPGPGQIRRPIQADLAVAPRLRAYPGNRVGSVRVEASCGAGAAAPVLVDDGVAPRGQLLRRRFRAAAIGRAAQEGRPGAAGTVRQIDVGCQAHPVAHRDQGRRDAPHGHATSSRHCSRYYPESVISAPGVGIYMDGQDGQDGGWPPYGPPVATGGHGLRPAPE